MEFGEQGGQSLDHLRGTLHIQRAHRIPGRNIGSYIASVGKQPALQIHQLGAGGLVVKLDIGQIG
ncbi:hypothetical protein D3C81_2034000 [compost metagenome]